MADRKHRCAEPDTRTEPPRVKAMSARPKVSIGLAVYNGEKYLEEAMESILGQTYRDFEVVICDNASTDGTADICKRFAAADERVRYYRNPANIGGVRNENRSMYLSRGEYFKLAAHDDKIDTKFLEKCVAVLEADSRIDVCVTGAFFIDGDGRLVETRVSEAGTERWLHQRIRSIASWGYACEAAYGLMRMSALNAVRPQENHIHSDRIVLTELALRTRFHLIAEPLFFKRIHEGNAYKDWRGRMAWYQPQLKVTGEIRFPHWRQVLDYVAMYGRTHMSPLNRVLCGLELLVCYWRMRRDLFLDVVDGVRMALRGRLARRVRYADEARWR